MAGVNVFALIRRHGVATWERRWKALLVAWLICLGGWAGIYAIPDRYEVSARVFADADAVLGTLLRGIALDSSPAGQVELLQRTLLSRPNLESVLDRSGLVERIDEGNTREQLLERLARDIRLATQTRNLFTVQYRDGDPEMALSVVQSTLEIFTEAAVGTDRQQFENARQFLLQQISHYETRLREAERRRAEFQAEYIDLLPSEANGGVSRLEAGRGRLQQLRGELTDAKVRRDLTKRQLDGTPAVIAETGEGTSIGRLAEAERSLLELRLRYTDRHPEVVAARGILAELRTTGGAAVRATGARSISRPNPLHEQLKVRMVDVEAQIGSLERQVNDGQADVERLDVIARGVPEVQAQFMNLDRDYTVLRRNFEELLARRESIQIADAARTGSERVKLEVVDPPKLPTRPVSPQRRLLAAGVLAAGLGAGAALAFLLAQLDGTFYTVQDLRRIGLPVVGGISTAQQPARRILSAAAFSAACVLLLLAFGAVVVGPEQLAEMVA